MYGEAAIGLIRVTPFVQSRVRRVAVPRAAHELSTLAVIDYEEAFVAETDSARERTGEEWARATLEGAPAILRSALPWGWRALGLRHTPTGSLGSVHGWEIRLRTPDVVLLGASSHFGMPAELLFERQQNALLFGAFLSHENLAARAAWAGIVPGHRQVVRYLIDQAVSSATY